MDSICFCVITPSAGNSVSRSSVSAPPEEEETTSSAVFCASRSIRVT